MKLLKNSVFHDKLKHIEIKYHYIKDMMQRGAVKLQYVVMDKQIVDVLNKPLARVKFEYSREKLGVLLREVMSSEDIDAHEPFSHGGRCVLPWCKYKGCGCSSMVEMCTSGWSSV